MEFNYGKHKANSASIPAWLDALVGPYYLDFIAPYSLEDSLKRLKDQETYGFFRFRKVKVDLIPQDADTFGFYLKRWGSKYPTIEARGLLKRWETDTTHVRARVNVAPHIYLIYLAIIPIMFFFLGPWIWELVWFAPLFLGLMILIWYIERRRRLDVVRIIEDALAADYDEP